jgi:hypothetical protein
MSAEGDVVLIHYQEKPAVYARIEWIEPDIKKDWYQVTLLFLTVPSQTVTWILREAYINGETFTMGGQSMRLEPVERHGPPTRTEESDQSSDRKDTGKPAKVLPFRKQKE